jgi:hypothetical protein
MCRSQVSTEIAVASLKEAKNDKIHFGLVDLSLQQSGVAALIGDLLKRFPVIDDHSSWRGIARNGVCEMLRRGLHLRTLAPQYCPPPRAHQAPPPQGASLARGWRGSIRRFTFHSRRMDVRHCALLVRSLVGRRKLTFSKLLIDHHVLY